jgi:hypothetical protein
MSDEDEHLRLVQRWLAGDVVRGSVGIRLVGGPYDGRKQIVDLDAEGNPPPTVRGGTFGVGVWHVYVAGQDGEERSSWNYRYAGTEPRPARWLERLPGDEGI